MTQHIRTNKEQLPILPIDNVSGIVYSTDQLSRPQRSRQTSRLYAKPHSHSAVLELFQNCLLGTFYPLRNTYAKVVAGTQTRLRKDFNLRSLHTRLRKGILNSFIMRKSTRLKEKQYGKKLNG